MKPSREARIFNFLVQTQPGGRVANKSRVDGKVLKIVLSIKPGEHELNVRRYQRLCSMLKSVGIVETILEEYGRLQIVRASRMATTSR